LLARVDKDERVGFIEEALDGICITGVSGR
jgi:hypothetical protein